MKTCGIITALLISVCIHAMEQQGAPIVAAAVAVPSTALSTIAQADPHPLQQQNKNDEAGSILNVSQPNPANDSALLDYIFSNQSSGTSTITFLLTKAIADHKTNIALGLLARGINPNESSGSTPLIVAAREGMLDVLKALREKGADINARDPQGRDALYFAHLKKHSAIQKYLLVNGAQYQPHALIVGIIEDNDEYIKNMLTICKPNLNMTLDEHGNTPLIVALSHKRIKIVKELLKCGAKPNLTNKERYTPLLIAVEHETTDAVDLLLNWDANANLGKLEYGSTPKLRIIKCEYPLNKAIEDKKRETIQSLLDKNADPNQISWYETETHSFFNKYIVKTSLTTARESHDLEIIKMITPKCTQDVIKTELKKAKKEKQTEIAIYLQSCLDNKTYKK